MAKVNDRRKGRIFALQLLYEQDMCARQVPLGDLMSRHTEAFSEGNAFDEQIQTADESGRSFGKLLCDGVGRYLSSLDETIEDASDNWRVERMSPIDRNVLRLAVYELLHHPSTPPAVVINEAIDIVKTYGNENSSKFVNGILNKIHKSKKKK